MPSVPGVAHLGLTVRDMQASAEWYQRVLGWRPLRHFEKTGAGTPRILMHDPETMFALSLCQPEDALDGGFDHRRAGLDHVALTVRDESELDEWIAHLDQVGVAHSPKRDLGPAKFVSFEDPDGIQFELWLQVSPPPWARTGGGDSLEPTTERL